LGLAAGIALSLAPGLRASITYVCDPSIASNPDVPAGTCNYLNTTIAGLYSSTFSNANATIYIQLGSPGGESSFLRNGISYATYTSDFEAESTDAAALATLPTSEPDGLSGDVFLTAAQAEALGIDVFLGGSNDFGVEADGMTPCQLGTSGCYNGVISIGGDLYFRTGGPITDSEYDFFTIAEHETDEVLGTASCLTFSGTPPPNTTTIDGCTDTNGDGLSPADLYRYSSPGTLAWINAASDNLNLGAYFSVNGGNTVIATYHNSPDGGDFGDWIVQPMCVADLVQDYALTPGCSPDITTEPGTPEIQLLNAAGFNLAAGTPEPATLGLMGAGLAVFGILGCLRRRRT
jgi:hypothetical protein